MALYCATHGAYGISNHALFFVFRSWMSKPTGDSARKSVKRSRVSVGEARPQIRGGSTKSSPTESQRPQRAAKRAKSMRDLSGMAKRESMQALGAIHTTCMLTAMSARRADSEGDDE